MKNALILILLIASSLFAWNPDAGTIAPLTKNAMVTATSTYQDNEANLIIDGDDLTYWLSDACLPTGFYTRTDLNLL